MSESYKSQTLTSQVFQVLSGQNKESISITFFLTKCAAHKYQNARQKLLPEIILVMNSLLTFMMLPKCTPCFYGC